ncbi:PREDICTED: uncharacterized protein LOC105366213 [Ceratosolen solmsi marchali]|uniref:Uncharacterized protein LOC105366213 n=1 Tax=Ceratosolen solmsi marchali TaxID=326594 RepID=A0AAJ7E079_9HYME|nr:PREDICTED: uncharacterized protein LOC105366213 [Ceratosolen solmsi marchali]
MRAVDANIRFLDLKEEDAQGTRPNLYHDELPRPPDPPRLFRLAIDSIATVSAFVIATGPRTPAPRVVAARLLANTTLNELMSCSQSPPPPLVRCSSKAIVNSH